MINEKTWDEFRASGLLWFINRTLHLFGWAIVVDVKDEKALRAYPARCKFRGFDNKSEDEGFLNLSTYLEKNIKELKKEVEEE